MTKIWLRSVCFTNQVLWSKIKVYNNKLQLKSSSILLIRPADYISLLKSEDKGC